MSFEPTSSDLAVPSSELVPSLARPPLGALEHSGTPEGCHTIVEARDDRRLRSLVDAHFDFVWRSLRRLGLQPDIADDAAQQVFLVVSRRLPDIARGAEKSFLFTTAVKVASDARRSVARRREEQLDDFDDHRPARDQAPNPEELTDQKRARELLDVVLGSMPMELRAVFVLFEIEGLGQTEAAELLGIPTGTCVSRLKRAREAFQAAVKRLRAREEFAGRSR